MHAVGSGSSDGGSGNSDSDEDTGVVTDFSEVALNDDDAEKLLCMSMDGAQGGEQLFISLHNATVPS